MSPLVSTLFWHSITCIKTVFMVWKLSCQGSTECCRAQEENIKMNDNLKHFLISQCMQNVAMKLHNYRPDHSSRTASVPLLEGATTIHWVIMIFTSLIHACGRSAERAFTNLPEACLWRSLITVSISLHNTHSWSSSCSWRPLWWSHWGCVVGTSLIILVVALVPYLVCCSPKKTKPTPAEVAPDQG